MQYINGRLVMQSTASLAFVYTVLVRVGEFQCRLGFVGSIAYLVRNYYPIYMLTTACRSLSSAIRRYRYFTSCSDCLSPPLISLLPVNFNLFSLGGKSNSRLIEAQALLVL
jgi:hypothetical protein